MPDPSHENQTLSWIPNTPPGAAWTGLERTETDSALVCLDRANSPLSREAAMRRGPRGGYQGGGGSGGSSTPTCKFYAQGYCSKGADCKFAHVDDDPPQRQSQGRGGGGGGGSRVCKYFLESRCTHGVNCRFEHPGAGQARTNVNVPNNGGALPNNRGGTGQSGDSSVLCDDIRHLHLLHISPPSCTISVLPPHYTKLNASPWIPTSFVWCFPPVGVDIY